MKFLDIPDEVHFTFGPVQLLIFSQKAELMKMLDPTEYSMEFLVDELRHRQYKLVEAQQYRATPALTGTVMFLFRSPDTALDDICTCDSRVIYPLLRGNMGEPWQIQMATMPVERDGSPTERTVLRIHLMPISETGNSVQREQVRSCEYG